MEILGRGGHGRLSHLAGMWRVASLAVACAIGLACALLPVAYGAAAKEPHAGSASGPVSSTLANEQLTTVACPSVAQCTALDVNGNALTFNPSAPGQPVRVPIAPGTELQSIACPSVSQCTVLAGADEETFDPEGSAPATVHAVQGDYSVTGNPADGAAPTAIACPAVSQCTELASDADGYEYTFDPDAFTQPTAVKIDPGTADGATAIACPSVSQCTVVDTSGREASFDPLNPGDPSPVTVDYPVATTAGNINPDGGSLYGVACPSPTQCTGVDDGGQEVTFNPTSPGTPTPVDDVTDSFDVACPSLSVCVAGGSEEKEFEPASPSVTTQAVPDETASSFAGIACPATDQCTGVAGSPSSGTAAVIVTFDPTVPYSTSGPGSGSPGPSGDVASPTHVRVSGEKVIVTLTCPRVAACHPFRLSLTMREALEHGKVTAVSAKHSGRRTKTVTIARATASFATAARPTVTLRIDKAARGLLSRFRRLKVRLSFATTTAGGVSVRPASRVLTLHAPRRR